MAGKVNGLSATPIMQIGGTSVLVDPLIGNISRSPSISVMQNFQNLATLPTGSLLGNQWKQYVVTLAGSATSNIDLSAASANVNADATATFLKVCSFILWMPTVAQMPAGLGVTVQGSEVDVGAAPATACNLFMSGHTDSIQLFPGRAIMYLDVTLAHFIDMTTNKHVLFTNIDAVVTSTVIFAVLGTDS